MATYINGQIVFEAGQWPDVDNVTVIVNGSGQLALNLANANTWTGVQTFGNNISIGGAQLAVALLASGHFIYYNGTNWVNVVPITGTTLTETSGQLALNLANANTWTGVQTFNSVIQTSQNGFTSNTGFGTGALNSNAGSNFNSAFGYQALLSNTTGVNNSAFGYATLFKNTTGVDNSAFGYAALSANTTGNFNCAFGFEALLSNTTGIGNSAFGIETLNSFNDTTGTGDYLVAVGFQAGYNYTGAERNDVVIGASVLGTVGESNVLRIGNPNGTLLYGSMVAPFYLSVLGGLGMSGVTSVAVAYTSTLADFLLVVSAAVTVTLPAASAQKGHLLLFRNTSTGTVTIAPAGTDTSETTSLTTGQSALLVADGTSKWYDVGKSIV